MESGRITQEEADRVDRICIRNRDRLLQIMLEAGADPDMRGDPLPFTEKERGKFPLAEGIEYLSRGRGSRALNEAIKKGMVWGESQVDLLLRYTALDEDSLAAARESGDPAMVEKIRRLWNRQRPRRQAPAGVLARTARH